MYEITRLQMASTTISYETTEELCDKINSLRAYELLSIKPTLPPSTDTKNHVAVHYLTQKEL